MRSTPLRIPRPLVHLRLNPPLQHVSIRYRRTELPLELDGEREAVSLPDLRTIEIFARWKIDQFPSILECLKLPTNLNEIKVNARPEGTTHILFATLHSTISPRKIQRLVIQEADDVDRALHYRRHATKDPALPQQAPILILKSPKTLEDLLKLGEFRILGDLLHLGLELRILPMRSYLEGILEMILGLAKLAVRLRGGETSLFGSLSQEIIKYQMGSDKATPLLPSLQDLGILDVFFSGPGLKETILSCCRSRKNHGFLLKNIRIAGCLGGDPAWVGVLREVARDVDWDGPEEQPLDSPDDGAAGLPPTPAGTLYAISSILRAGATPTTTSVACVGEYKFLFVQTIFGNAAGTPRCIDIVYIDTCKCTAVTTLQTSFQWCEYLTLESAAVFRDPGKRYDLAQRVILSAVNRRVMIRGWESLVMLCPVAANHPVPNSGLHDRDPLTFA